MIGIYVISIVLFIIMNTALCFVKDKEKNSLFFVFLDVLSIIVLVAIMTHANYSDLPVYERHYSFSKYDMLNSRFEGGFNWYMVFCRHILKLSFTQFKFVTFSLCIILFYLTYRKITYNFSYFVMIFMMYEIFFNGVQIRNFMAISLVAFGIPYLIKGSVKGIATYILLVILAFSIHHSALAYLAFVIIVLPFRKIFNSKMSKIIMFFIAGVFLFVLVDLAKKGTLKQMLISISYQYVSYDVGNRVVSHSGGRWGNSQIYLFGVILLYFASVYIFSNGNIVSKISNYKYKLSLRHLVVRKERLEVDLNIKKHFLFLNFIAIFYIVLCVFSSTFYRLLRGMCLIDIIYFAAIINNTSRKEWRVIVLVLSFILNCIWIYYDLVVPQRFFEHILGYLR